MRIGDKLDQPISQLIYYLLREVYYIQHDKFKKVLKSLCGNTVLFKVFYRQLDTCFREIVKGHRQLKTPLLTVRNCYMTEMLPVRRKAPFNHPPSTERNCYMAEILPIRRKAPFNKSITQSINS